MNPLIHCDRCQEGNFAVKTDFTGKFQIYRGKTLSYIFKNSVLQPAGCARAVAGVADRRDQGKTPTQASFPQDYPTVFFIDLAKFQSFLSCLGGQNFHAQVRPPCSVLPSSPGGVRGCGAAPGWTRDCHGGCAQRVAPCLTPPSSRVPLRCSLSCRLFILYIIPCPQPNQHSEKQKPSLTWLLNLFH